MQTKTAGAIVVLLGAATFSADAARFTDTPVQPRQETVAAEHIRFSQEDTVVETKLPWKGEPGLTVRYDMGEPTLKERMKDKRDETFLFETVPLEGFEPGAQAIKFDIVLDEKPDTTIFCSYLEGWENYDFLRIAPLTDKEKAQGDYQPEEADWSIAVYHKSKANHATGGQNYGTGKHSHIMYPYVWELNDLSTKQRATALTFQDGNLCVDATDFLNDTKRQYPVRIDPSFGYTSIGASTGSLTADSIYVGRYTLSDDNAQVYEIQKYNGSTLNTNANRAVIYGETSSDPGALIALGSEVGLNTANQWNTLPISTTLSAGSYYIGWFADNNHSYRYDNGVGTLNINGSVTYPTPADPFASETEVSRRASVYANYTIAAPPASGETGVNTQVIQVGL